MPPTPAPEDPLRLLAARFDHVSLLSSAGWWHISGWEGDARSAASGRDAREAALSLLGLLPPRPCRACGGRLPPSAFHACRSRPDGLATRCRPCERRRVAECKRRRGARGGARGGAVRPPDQDGAAPRVVCLTCDLSLPRAAFYRRARSPTGLCRNCKACERLRWGPQGPGAA